MERSGVIPQVELRPGAPQDDTDADPGYLEVGDTPVTQFDTQTGLRVTEQIAASAGGITHYDGETSGVINYDGPNSGYGDASVDGGAAGSAHAEPAYQDLPGANNG